MPLPVIDLYNTIFPKNKKVPQSPKYKLCGVLPGSSAGLFLVHELLEGSVSPVGSAAGKRPEFVSVKRGQMKAEVRGASFYVCGGRKCAATCAILIQT